MSRARRLLGWAVFLGFLGAVGIGVFHFVRYRPRFTIPDLLSVRQLSADGSRLVTTKLPGLNRLWDRGPVQVWDTHRGRVVNEFVGDVTAWFHFSRDGPIVAAGLEDGTLHLIDWRSGRDCQIEDVELMPLSDESWPRHWFSARGDRLYVAAAGEKRTCIINVATQKAVLRLQEKFLHFSNDGRFAFVRNGADIDVWDLEAAKKVASLATISGWIMESPDGKTLLTGGILTAPTAVDSPGLYAVDLWDSADFKLRFHRELSPARPWWQMFSGDSRTLAFWSNSDLTLVDANTGRLLGAHKMEHCHVIGFSADSSLWFMLHGSESKERLTMGDAASGRVLWEKPGRCSPEFIDHARIAHQERGKPVQLIDARSGEPITAMPVACASDHREFWTNSWIHNFVQTSDRRHFVFAGRQRRDREPQFREGWLEKWWPSVFGDGASALVVMESATGRELFRLANAGNQWNSLMLSDDASTLVTVDSFDDGRSLVRIWDVQPMRAWRWAIGVAAGTGLGWLALRWAWRRRKIRKPATTEAAASD